MLYMNKGDIYLTESAKKIDLTKNLKRLYRETGNARKLKDVLIFIFLCYSYKDNHFYPIPLDERKIEVIEKRKLWGYSPGKNTESIIEEIETKECKAFVEYYIKVQLTPNAINRERLKIQMEKWRKLMEECEDPNKIKDFQNAFSNFVKMYNDADDIVKQEGALTVEADGAIGLFEIHEKARPAHQKI